MRIRPIYEVLAGLVNAHENCVKANNAEWRDIHKANMEQIVKDFLPSGSGWDQGTKLLDTSKPERLVFCGSFHHMDEYGGYDGWTTHEVIVTPSLQFGFLTRITGPDRNGIKDDLSNRFQVALTQHVHQVASERGPKGFIWDVVDNGPDPDVLTYALHLALERHGDTEKLPYNGAVRSAVHYLNKLADEKVQWGSIKQRLINLLRTAHPGTSRSLLQVDREEFGAVAQAMHPEAHLNPWKDNSVQFPRLIAEANMAGAFANVEVMRDMCESMDLSEAQIAELLHRAEREWSLLKKGILSHG